LALTQKEQVRVVKSTKSTSALCKKAVKRTSIA
jgi:hypothetical protein